MTDCKINSPVIAPGSRPWALAVPGWIHQELSGSLGDLGTFLPLSVALAVTTGMSFGLILIFAGLMNVLTGLRFRQPIAVQPMQVIAATAIAGGLSAGQVASAGIFMGVLMLVLAMTGGIAWISRVVPRPVVRGLQMAVGLKLAAMALAWLGKLPAIGWDSWLIAAVCGAFLAVCLTQRLPVLLYVFVLGFGLLWLNHPDAYDHFALQLPAFHLVHLNASDWWAGLTGGAIPQFPLTLLNSVIAVCALSQDYFPGRGVAPKSVAGSIALMNLLCVPFGGMPMCHGADGLAAQYRFGARTGGSVIFLGGLKVAAGLLFGGALVGVLRCYPRSILAVMLAFAGYGLASAAKDCLRGRSLLVVAAMAVAALTLNVLAAFLLGCVLDPLLRLVPEGGG